MLPPFACLLLSAAALSIALGIVLPAAGAAAENTAENADGRAGDAAAGKDEVRVMIAVPLRGSRRVISCADRFLVVVENGSQRRLRFWTGREHRGFANLSFELRDQSGKAITVHRAPLPPGSESDMSLELEPGDCYVLPVHPGDGTWEGFPMPSPARDLTFTMHAVLDNAQEAIADPHAWIGRQLSADRTYTFCP